MSEEPKPCPFCGEIPEKQNKRYAIHSSVFGTWCPLGGHPILITDWNRRADNPEVASLRSQLTAEKERAEEMESERDAAISKFHAEVGRGRRLAEDMTKMMREELDEILEVINREKLDPKDAHLTACQIVAKIANTKHWVEKENGELRAQVAALTEKVAAGWAAFRTYGGHAELCFQMTGRPCSCGFDRVASEAGKVLAAHDAAKQAELVEALRVPVERLAWNLAGEDDVSQWAIGEFRREKIIDEVLKPLRAILAKYPKAAKENL